MKTENVLFLFLDCVIFLALVFLLDQAEHYCYSEFSENLFCFFKIVFGVLSIFAFLGMFFADAIDNNSKNDKKSKKKPR